MGGPQPSYKIFFKKKFCIGLRYEYRVFSRDMSAKRTTGGATLKFPHPKVSHKVDASAESIDAAVKRLSKLYSLPFPKDFVDLFNYCQVVEWKK